MPIYIDNQNNLITYDSIDNLYVILQDGEHNIELSSWNYDSPYLDADLMQQLIDQYVRADTTVGTITTLPPIDANTLAEATVTNSGTARKPILDFQIPAGLQGIKGNIGDTGLAATIALDPVVEITPATSPSVYNNGDINNAVFEFSLPRAAQTILDTTLTVNPDQNPSVSRSTDANGDNILQFSLPLAPDFTVGTVLTGAAGTSVEVNDVGINGNIELNFTIPQGIKGDTGQGFIIGAIFNSVAELLVGSVNDGEFGLVAGTLDPADADYGKLYLYKNLAWVYQTDMSVQGIQGPSGTLEIATPATVGDPNTDPSIIVGGTIENATLAFTLPRARDLSLDTTLESTPAVGPNVELTEDVVGDQTLQFTLPRAVDFTVDAASVVTPDTNPSVEITTDGNGDKSLQFSLPRAADTTIGTITVLNADQNPSVIDNGVNGDINLEFSLPRTAIVTVDTPTVLLPNQDPSVLDNGTDGDVNLVFSLPQAATTSLNAIPVVVLDPDQSPTVTNSGLNGNSILQFELPSAPSFTVGTVSTGVEGGDVTITNVGVNGNIELNFSIPRGDTGANFTILGIYNTLGDLQTAHPTGSAGDAWAIGITTTKDVYIWDINSNSWELIGTISTNLDAASINIIDENTYYINDNVEDVLQEVGLGLTNKQDILINQTNIKSINGNSLLGSGDIIIENSLDAIDIPITDTNNYYTGINVETALQEVGYALSNIDLDTINLTINSSIIPDTDSTYDLGSSIYKWRDLYLSGSSIHLGAAIISENAGVIQLPEGTTIGSNSLDNTIYIDTLTEIGNPISMTATYVSITDTNNYFTSTQVEGALQEVGNDISSLSNQLNNLVLGSGDTNAEVIAARGSFSTLGDRLNDSDSSIGSQSYTQQNYITNNEALSTSIDYLDIALASSDNNISSLTTDVNTVENNITTINNKIGSLTYAEQNYILNGNSITQNFDILDQAVNGLDSVTIQKVGGIVTENITMQSTLNLSNGVKNTAISQSSTGLELTSTEYGGAYRLPRFYTQTSETPPATMQNGDFLFIYTE